MKLIGFLILIICFVKTTHAQDFELENKCFLLQDYYFSNNIKSLIVKESNDSTKALEIIKSKCFFDKKGRLTKIQDYYYGNNNNSERSIFYTYHGDENYFTSKSYVFYNEFGIERYKQDWIIHRDSNSRTVTESIKNNKGKIYRQNILHFNVKGKLVSRTTYSSGIEYKIYYGYDQYYRLKTVKLKIKNETIRNESGNQERVAFFLYNLNNKLITTEQRIPTSNKQLYEYYYVYKGFNIYSKIGWNYKHFGEEIHKSIARTNYYYDEKGYLNSAHIYTDNDSIVPEKYNNFEFDFFNGNKSRALKNTTFVGIFYSSFFNIY